MPRLDRSFAMEETPTEAQARFRDEVGQALHAMGFRLDVDTPGHLEFHVRYQRGVLWTGLVPKASRHNVAADFTDDDQGTKVDISGTAPGDLAALINVLGRQGHWPSNRGDPGWVAEGMPESPQDDLASWDDTEIDPSQLDPITRRALRKAGKLPS